LHAFAAARMPAIVAPRDKKLNGATGYPVAPFRQLEIAAATIRTDSSAATP
jgi:hypothetical protein